MWSKSRCCLLTYNDTIIDNDRGVLNCDKFIVVFSTTKVGCTIRISNSTSSTAYSIPDVNACTFDDTYIFFVIITFNIEPLTIIISGTSPQVNDMFKTWAFCQTIRSIRKSVVALTDLPGSFLSSDCFDTPPR